jgi:hypothetical protein
MAGGAWLAWRAMEPWRREHALASSLKIRSDQSPLEPDHTPGATTGGLLVGYTTDSGKPIYIDDEHLMRHLFIIGQSGVGKTVAASLLMFQQIQRGGGLLFIDGKIDAANLAQIYHYCCYTGRQHDFLVINPDDPDNSNTYNPVLFGDADEKADGILQLIPSTETNPGADFFKQEAKQALTTLIRALQRARLAYNVIDLTVLLMNGNAMLELERKLATAAPNSAELKEFTLFLDKFRVQPSPQNPSGGIDMKKLKDVFGGIGGRLYSFGTGKFGQIMNTYDPEVNLYEAIRGNKIIYCALPTMGKDTTARNFGRMVIADLRTAISWLQKLPEKDRPWPPFMAFCDEAGSYLNENWSRIPEQSRSAHVFFVPAVQTVANFQAISDELYEMVIGNAWTKLIFKVGTQGTAEEAAELIGKKIGVLRSLAGTTAESSSMSMLRHLPESNQGAGASMASGEREQEMYIITPDELKGLQKGEAVMTYGGDQIFNIRIPGLPMTVVQADGENVRPVETDEFQIAIAETYDVVVTPTEDRAYGVIAEAIDRSGLVRATLAPKVGMTGEVPKLRARPLLTMKDMGMDHAMPMELDLSKPDVPMMAHSSINMRDFSVAPKVKKNAGVASLSPMPAERIGDAPTGLEDVDHRVLRCTSDIPRLWIRYPQSTMKGAVYLVFGHAIVSFRRPLIAFPLLRSDRHEPE